MEDYLETVLKLPVKKNYVNIQAIVRNDDKLNLLRLVIYHRKLSVNEL